MALTPLFTRQASASDLEAAINAFLSGLPLNSTINGVEIEQARNEPVAGSNLFATVSANPGAGAAAAAHYVFNTFSASSEPDCVLLVNTFIANNPARFFSPVYGVYRPTNVNPQVGVTLGIFSNTDAANGAANWIAGGGSGSAPGGVAGGDLTGTYPNPTLVLIGAATGPIGDGTHVPVVTIDAKGRVTALTSAAITYPSSLPPSGAAGGDLAGTYPNPTVAQASQAFALPGDITPTILGADTNDYAPTGLATASTIRISSSLAVNLTGLTGGADGRIIILQNVGAFTITLKNNNAGSAAANRFILTADLALAPSAVAMLQYDATTSLWMSIGAGGGGASATNFLTGATVWVDAAVGNDGTGARNSANLPFQTIGAAVTASVSGDNIIVHAGSYTPSGSINKDGVTIWCEENVLISYNTTLINGVGNGATFKLMGRASLTATGSSARLVNVSGQTSNIYVQIDSHATSAANSSAMTLLNGDCRVYISVFQDFIANTSGGMFQTGSGFTGSASSRVIIIAGGDITNTGTGAAIAARGAGSGFIRAQRIRNTGGGDALNCGSTGQNNWNFYADQISGGSSGVNQNNTTGMNIQCRLITGTAGPGVIISNAVTMTITACDSISGTTAGISATSTGTLNVSARSITASAGPGISQTGAGTINIVGNDIVSGTTFGINQTTSAGVINHNGRSVSASGGPAVEIATGSYVGIVGGDFTGTTFGVRATGTGAITITRANNITASAGPGVSQEGTAAVSLFCANITGTSRGILTIAAGTVRGTIRTITASAGPAIENSTSAGDVDITVFQSISGTTRGLLCNVAGTVTVRGLANWSHTDATNGLLDVSAGTVLVEGTNLTATAQAGFAVTGGTLTAILQGTVTCASDGIRASAGTCTVVALLGIRVSAGTAALNASSTAVVNLIGSISASGSVIGVLVAGTASVSVHAVSSTTAVSVATGKAVSVTGAGATLTMANATIKSTGDDAVTIVAANTTCTFRRCNFVATTLNKLALNLGAGTIIQCPGGGGWSVNSGNTASTSTTGKAVTAGVVATVAVGVGFAVTVGGVVTDSALAL